MLLNFLTTPTIPKPEALSLFSFLFLIQVNDREEGDGEKRKANRKIHVRISSFLRINNIIPCIERKMDLNG